MLYYTILFTIFVLVIIIFYVIFKIVSTIVSKGIMNNAIALEKAGLIDQAIKIYTKELEINPKDIEKKLRLSRLLIKKKFYDTAIYELEDIINISENKPFEDEKEVLELLAEMYKIAYKKPEEFLTLKKLLILDPENIELHLRISDFLIGNFKLEESLHHLNKILELDPNNEIALFRKGMVMLETGKKKTGIKLLTHLVENNPNYAEAYEPLGFMYIKTNSKKAIEYFSAIKNNTKEIIMKVEAASMVAYIHSLSYDWEEAVNQVKELETYKEKLDSETATDLYMILAYGYYFMEKYEIAEDKWHDLLKLDFNFVEAYESIKSRDFERAKTKMLKIWNEHFSKKKYKSITNKLASLKIAKVSSAYDFDKLLTLFNKWVESRGIATNAADKDKNFLKIDNAADLSKVSVSDFKDTIVKIISSIGYKIDHEFSTNEGYDAIVIKNKVKYLLLARKWAGTIGEIQISQLITDIKKRNYKAGIIMCCGKYSSGGKDLAKKSSIKLIDAAKIDNYISHIV